MTKIKDVEMTKIKLPDLGDISIKEIFLFNERLGLILYRFAGNDGVQEGWNYFNPMTGKEVK